MQRESIGQQWLIGMVAQPGRIPHSIPHGDAPALGSGTFCPPHGPALAALVQLLLLLVGTVPFLCWFQHSLTGCPELLPTGFAWELLLGAPVQELGPFLPHCEVVPVVQLTISTGTPGRWDLSNPSQGGPRSPKHLRSPQSQGADTWTLCGAQLCGEMENSSIPRVSSEGCGGFGGGCGQVPTQKGWTQPLPAPAVVRGQVHAGICSCAHPECPGPLTFLGSQGASEDLV